MSAVGKLEVGSAREPPLLHTVEEAAEVLRIGRTLAYALARRYEDTGGLEGLPVIRLGNCLRVPRWALLELALNGRTVPLGELTSGSVESRRLLDAELARIDRLGREADSRCHAHEHHTSAPDGQLSRPTAPAARPHRSPSSSSTCSRPPEEPRVPIPSSCIQSSKSVQTSARERAGVGAGRCCG